MLAELNRVTGYAIENGDRAWEAKVTGEASGLVAANGHLLVSTSDGSIYCFGAPIKRLWRIGTSP